MRKTKPLVLFLFLLIVLSGEAQNDTVVFSVRGGFYDDVFALQLYNIIPQNQIHYTLNGNRPTAQSPLYEVPLQLDYCMYSKSDIFTIINCPEEDFFLPDSIRHCIVIRAAVFDENDSCVSQVATNSYFINALGCDTHGLPALSLCADSLDLFDYERGIFVPGVHFDSLNPYFTGNYFMKGREWERLCNVEFYEVEDNAGINQLVGLRTHGKQSRWSSQKGYSLYAREEYGKKRMRYKFFDTTPIEKFKRLSLKPYSSSFNGSGCADYISNRIAQNLNVEAMSSRPCVLFINGEYWGVYYVEEKPDEHYLADHWDVDDDSVNIIKEWFLADCGNPDNYYALYAWLEQANLADETQYAYVETQIDMENCIDYYIFELFSENLDWPANDVRMWQENDGPWRWIFYDGDGCLHEQGMDVFANATYDGDSSYPSNRRATLFFRRLLENESFMTRFCDRFNRLAFTTFSYENTKPYFDYITQQLRDEVPNQVERFNKPHAYSTWENYCIVVHDHFLRDRSERIVMELNDFLSVEEPSTISVQCYPNPFSDEIRLGIESEGFGAKEVAIYDVMGRKVYVQPCCLNGGYNEIVLCPQINPGVYVLKLDALTLKIVKR